MKLILTFQELKDNYDWDLVCKVLGLNPWCFNESISQVPLNGATFVQNSTKLIGRYWFGEYQDIDWRNSNA